ncbi:hypothetical protein C8255_13715 [filamentous cyanobacterium CCP3]|nr:hypothetical protein C8255_13715 [filamentous cyanobacterium CCP3]
MATVEFEASVKNGVIEVPAAHQGDLVEGGKVKVIVLTSTTTAKRGLIAELMANPIQLDNTTPLSREEVHDRSL